MRAVSFQGTDSVAVVEKPVPEPQGDQVLIQVAFAGICGTDLSIASGKHPRATAPLVMGHEFSGQVAALPTQPSSDLAVGDWVTVFPLLSCGECYICQMGLPHVCKNLGLLGIDTDGAFAEYLTLPISNLHIIPDTLPLYAAVFVEPLAACFRITEQVHINPSHRVVVLGDGKLGLMAAQVMRLNGCALLAVGRYTHKLKILDRLGIRTVMEKDLDTNERFDVVIESTGSPEGFYLARSLVDPAGTIVQKSTYTESVSVDISSLVVDEISVIGSRCGPFEPAIRALMRGLVNVQELIDRRFPLEMGLQAFEYAMQDQALKVILEMKTYPAEGLREPGELQQHPVI